jgi:hypothetical protein
LCCAISLFFIIFFPISNYSLISKRLITLDEKFLCCSRLHYENLNYKNDRCTFEGEINEYNTFDKNKCIALKPTSPTAQSIQATKPVVSFPLSSIKAAAAFRISNCYVLPALSLVLACFS